MHEAIAKTTVIEWFGIIIFGLVVVCFVIDVLGYLWDSHKAKKRQGVISKDHR